MRRKKELGILIPVINLSENDQQSETPWTAVSLFAKWIILEIFSLHYKQFQ